MLQLSANDVVNFMSYNILTSSTDGLNNAQGFYYSPLGGAATAVAWAVTTTLGSTPGPITVLSFSMTKVNLQGVWNNSTNTVTIPAAGTYFVSLTMRLLGNCANKNNGILACR
jgi:hypothetical protein